MAITHIGQPKAYYREGSLENEGIIDFGIVGAYYREGSLEISMGFQNPHAAAYYREGSLEKAVSSPPLSLALTTVKGA